MSAVRFKTGRLVGTVETYPRHQSPSPVDRESGFRFSSPSWSTRKGREVLSWSMAASVGTHAAPRRLSTSCQLEVGDRRISPERLAGEMLMSLYRSGDPSLWSYDVALVTGIMKAACCRTGYWWAFASVLDRGGPVTPEYVAEMVHAIKAHPDVARVILSAKIAAFTASKGITTGRHRSEV